MKTLALLLGLLFASDGRATRIEGAASEALFDRPCSTTQLQELKVREKAVYERLLSWQREWLLWDLAGVRRDFVLPENRTWVEANPQHTRYQNYWLTMGKTIQAMLAKSQQGLQFACQDESDRDCQGLAVIAYVRFLFGRPRPTIYLCPAFYASAAAAQSETLLHELSHLAASTEDYATDWWNRGQSDLMRAAKDAYHVQQFMHEPSDRVLRRQVWIWWWPR